MSPAALFVTTVPITIEAFLLPFAEHFRTQGWRVDALTREATRYPSILGAFDTLYDISWSRNPFALSDHFDTWSRVRRIVIEGDYDVVHVHSPIAAFVTRFALRSIPSAERPAIIYTAHGFHFYEGQSFVMRTFFRTLERMAAPWTDFLVTINREDYDAARTFRRVDRTSIRYIPGVGVDVASFSPDAMTGDEARAIREELEIPPEAFMLTMVAELSKVKRHAHLIEALERVRDPDVIVVFVGSGGLEADLRQQVAARGLDTRVRWTGYRKDIPKILAASDALALVSAREGLPRSVLEAMAMGKPVIGTHTRGISDAVGDEAGWLVGKSDVQALADAIDNAAAQPTQVSQRGAAALARARDLYALSGIIDEYAALYAEARALRKQ